MLSEKHITLLQDRKIDVEVATRMGLYSGVRRQTGFDDKGDKLFEVTPDQNGSTLCFPFFENGIEVNTKYRAISTQGKRVLWQRKGGVKTPYNVDVVLDSDSMVDLETGTSALVWTEGEFDCIVAEMAGYRHSVSLPEGSVAARDGNNRLLPPVPDDTKDIDPANDDKFSFFTRHFDVLMMVKNHIIATDADEPGQRMAKEMVRRIGPARCLMITYPSEPIVPSKDDPTKLKPCKDLNDVLVHFGIERVQQILSEAKPWPLRGLYKLSDYPDTPDPDTFDSGICPMLDEHFRLYESAFVVVTGIPGSGKSTLINQIAVEMARRHRWPITLFSGEMPVKPYLMNPLMTAFLKKPKAEWSYKDSELAKAFVERYFSFIDYSVRANEDEDDINLDFVLAKCADACFRYGTRLLIIDPWNELDTSDRPGNVSQTEHDGLSIRKFKRFCKTYGCAGILVAHPTKMDAGQIPGLYSISGSANFANKAEVGLIVHAPDILLPEREIIIPKVKFRGTGQKGRFPISFDRTTDLFIPAPVRPMGDART